jgi:uncharacterized membrane protein
VKGVTFMAAVKLIALAFAVLLLLYVAGIFGPGSLVPGLGPVFDQTLTLAVVVVLVLAALPWLVRTVRKLSPSASSGSETPQSEEILRARYARGELDRNQFLLMLEDLRTMYPRKT